MEGLLKATKVNFLNQIAGGALLGFVFAFFIGLLFVFLSDLSIINKTYAEQSSLYSILITIAEENGWIIEGFKNLFGDFWEKFMATIDSVKTNIESK